MKVPRDVRCVKVNYNDKGQLADALRGVHTVLSFIVVQQDSGNVSQKTLVDACVDAGVTRFAPSEWAGASTVGLPWYAGKTAIEGYLKEINRERKVLEFCCFRPGMFMNYLAYPVKTTKYAEIWGIHVDMKQCRAIILSDLANPGIFGVTTVEDVAEVVAKAVDYQGEWPEIGGIRGAEVSIDQLIQLGEQIRGRPFTVEKIKSVHARTGRLPTSWYPEMGHSTVPNELKESAAKTFTAKTILSIYQGSWRVSDEWNKLLPDHRFMGVEEFLRRWWGSA